VHGPAFDITVTHGPGEARIAVAGELDIATSAALRDAIDHELRSGRAVVLDLEDVQFMDSSGLTVVIRAWRMAEEQGWAFRIAPSLSPAASRTAELAGVLPMLPMLEPAEAGRSPSSSSATRRSSGVVTLRFSRGASTTRTVPPSDSTSDASSVAAASTSSG
jgi:anti-sigma B factor antagonist